MNNVSREVAILRKTQKEMQGIKNAVKEMRDVFDGLIEETGGWN